MSIIAADLHSHTTRSDGTTERSEIASIASDRGLEAIAITDHDQFQPDMDAPIVHENGVDIVHGIELRVSVDELDERIDLLGYGVRETPELKEVTEVVKNNRKTRIGRMLELIEEETGVVLDYEPTTTSGRPHVARAIEESDELEYSYEEAFDLLIGDDCPCYTQRKIPTFEDGLEALRTACTFVSLAHPYRYEYPRAVLKLAKQLDGVECIYPYDNIEDWKTLGLDETAVEWFDLTMTGGSDAHEPEDIGKAGLLSEHYEQFLEAANLKEYSQHY